MQNAAAGTLLKIEERKCFSCFSFLLGPFKILLLAYKTLHNQLLHTSEILLVQMFLTALLKSCRFLEVQKVE